MKAISYHNKMDIREFGSYYNELLTMEKLIKAFSTKKGVYIKKEDATAQDALVCVATGKNVSDTKSVLRGKNKT